MNGDFDRRLVLNRLLKFNCYFCFLGSTWLSTDRPPERSDSSIPSGIPIYLPAGNPAPRRLHPV